MSLVPPGRAARPEAVSSLAPRLTSLGAPCVLASERPSQQLGGASVRVGGQRGGGPLIPS